MNNDKLYSQKEIKALLQKATELQKENIGQTEDGLTLEELEQIAADSGIDPMYIREAISRQNSGIPESSGFHLLGAPLSLEVGREVPYEMSMDDWELVVQEARRTFNKSGGTVQHLGKSFEWMSPDHKFIHASLTATPLKNKTRFYVSSHYGKIAFFAYYFPFVLLIMGLGIFLGSASLPPLINIAIAVASITSVFAGSRYFFGKWVQSRKKKMDDMITRFGKLIGLDDKRTSTKSDVLPQKENEPQISIPDEHLESNSSETENRTKTRS
tara:strand:- start:1458 stop:2267 length:810 start_codon:yes stop_codon:yes gene_type:complete